MSLFHLLYNVSGTLQPPQSSAHHCTMQFHLYIHALLPCTVHMHKHITNKWLYPLLCTWVFSVMTQFIFNVVVLKFLAFIRFYIAVHLVGFISHSFCFFSFIVLFPKARPKNKQTNMHAKSIHTNRKLDLCFWYQAVRHWLLLLLLYWKNNVGKRKREGKAVQAECMLQAINGTFLPQISLFHI